MTTTKRVERTQRRLNLYGGEGINIRGYKVLCGSRNQVGDCFFFPSSRLLLFRFYAGGGPPRY